jgi:beta-glucosidase-like glycosyl hydrolase
MANSTLKALIAFDGIIMTDYLQDYMLAMKGATHERWHA